MTLLKPRAQWLIIGILALLTVAAVLAFQPGTARAQQAPPPSLCGSTNEGFDDTVAIPPKPNHDLGKADFAVVTNLKDKTVDLVLYNSKDAIVVAVKDILAKQPAFFPKIKPITNIADALVEINNAYNANNPPKKLNVFIVGHGLPGQAQVGNDVIGNANQGQINKQAAFVDGINALPPAGTGKIEHLKFIECLTAFGDRGRAFLNKLRMGLGAAMVSGFTNKLTPIAPVPGFPDWPYPEFQNPAFNNKIVIQLPADPQKGVGGIVLDPSDIGALPLQTDSSSGSDAWLLAELIAGTAATAVVLGGGVWYTRRRRVR